MKSSFVALVMTVFLASSPVSAQEDWEKSPGGSSVWGEAARLTNEIGTLNLVDGLNLGAGQLREIIEPAREAERLREDHFKAHPDLVRDFIEVLRELKRILTRAAPSSAG